MHERLISSQHATLIACKISPSLLERNITLCVLRPHSAHAYPHAHCASVAALRRSKFSGVFVPNVFPPCRNLSRQCGGQRRHLAKNISSALHPQRRRTTEHVARTFLVSQSSRTCPRGCALDPRSLRLAPSSLRFTGRGCAAQLAQLPLACCKLEGSITTARLRHAGCQHGCAAQAALARSSLAEDGALRCSCRPADPRRLLTTDQAAGARVHGNSASHRR
jgi:hypothetical protein